MMRARSLLPAAALICGSGLAGAQTSTPATMGPVVIRSVVLDASTALPLSGAVLTLTAHDGAVVLPPRGGSPQLTNARAATSSATGAYVLSDVAAGRYELYVRRLGYQPTVLDVDLTAGSPTSLLSVGLVVLPIQLRTLRIRSDAPDLYGRANDVAVNEAVLRLAAARARQRDYLGTDVHELTSIDAAEAGAIGDADVFRALRRLPGVTGFDDHSVELWIRGARWDQSRVYFDGLPVFDPLHAAGTMAGIGGDAIGAAFLHPGVRPVSLGAQGASLIDLHSRAASSDSAVLGTGELSVFGVTGSVDQRSADGKLGLTVAGRRSLGDVIRRFPFDNQTQRGGHFTEISSRGDIDLGSGRALDLSGLWSKDYDGGPFPTGGGTALGQVTLQLPIGRFRSSHTIGLSRYASHGITSSVTIDSTTLDGFLPVFGVVPLSTSIDYWTLKGDLHSASDSSVGGWGLGYELVAQRAGYDVPSSRLSWYNRSDDRRVRRNSLDYGGVWGTRRWQPASRLTFETGLRVDAGEVGTASAMRLGPSLQAMYKLSPTARLSASASRSFEDAQEIPLVTGWSPAPPRGVWLLSGQEVPLLLADQINVGVEQWRGESVLMSANLYARRLTGVLTSRLSNGDSITNDPSWTSSVSSRLQAYGAEISARKLVGPVTGSIGYSYSVAMERTGTLTSAAPGDRRHALSATLVHHPKPWARAGLGFMAMSGLPYTRLHNTIDSAGTSYRPLSPISERRNALRAPVFMTTDLFLERTLRRGRASFTPYASVEIPLGRGLSTYLPGSKCGSSGLLGTSADCVNGDGFTHSAGVMPNVGIRIVF